MNEAAMAALDDKLASTETTSDTPIIKTSHFEIALSKVSPSVSDMVWFIFPNFSHLKSDNIVKKIYIGIYFVFLDQQKQYYQRLSESLKAA